MRSNNNNNLIFLDGLEVIKWACFVGTAQWWMLLFSKPKLNGADSHILNINTKEGGRVWEQGSGWLHREEGISQRVCSRSLFWCCICWPWGRFLHLLWLLFQKSHPKVSCSPSLGLGTALLGASQKPSVGEETSNDVGWSRAWREAVSFKAYWWVYRRYCVWLHYKQMILEHTKAGSCVLPELKKADYWTAGCRNS